MKGRYMSSAEIADELGVSVDSAYRYIFRAAAWRWLEGAKREARRLAERGGAR